MIRSIAFVALTGMFLIVGCGNKNSSTPMSSGVTDVSAPAPTYSAPTPVASAQPVTYDTMPTATASNNGGAMTMAGGSYTVKRGDTLYSIARSRYGDGKQWQKIAQANPGVRPESLKVGQTIQVP